MIVTELFVILALILANGIFAGAEIAIVSLRRTRLTQQTSAAVGVALTIGDEELQRHLSAQPGVIGDVDLASATGTEPLANVVVQDGLPGQRRCWHLIP